ncbi:MAG TPA: DUF1585 domain-containing protein [Pseudomonadota bacterium]|nr:DUF1585 domain-containing protein [Pseudomonadota bacterium]
MKKRRKTRFPLSAALAVAALSCSGNNMEMQPEPPFEPTAATSYTAKVKNLLTGLPATDAEVAAVSADPQVLAGLIDTWMALPQFNEKLQSFFQQAFQQTQVSLLQFDDQLRLKVQAWNPNDRVRFVQSATTSFARTAVQIVSSGQPFTNTITTDTFYLNPPLMAALAANDLYVFDDKDTYAPGNFLTRFPGFKYVRQTTTNIPYDQSMDPTNANFMNFYDPMPNTTSPNAGCTTYPRTFNTSPTNNNTTSLTLQTAVQRLWGGRAPCGYTESVFTDADYDNWRLVKIRKPAGSEQTIMPWEVVKMRNAATTELVLNTPRYGFMSTLAFNANWATNGSNLHRVTMNQTLIVALGQALTNPNGAAAPIGETGGDQSLHAKPGTACYGCHTILDPLRNYFRQSYSVASHVQTLSLAMLPADQATATYNFDGQMIAGKGGGIAEFAGVLAASPSFANAWTQKLCQYANSSDCVLEDPEFQRVSDAFKASNFNFKTLVRTLFSSPLITGAARTKTATDNGTVISVARREHLCMALSTRLGVTDACNINSTKQTIYQDLSFGIPGSGYSRGSTSPLLPHDPDLFFYSAVENLCSQYALLMIDPTKTCISSKGCYKSTDPVATNIDAFVATFMGLTANDERKADLTKILNDHYAEAMTVSGTTAKSALQSVFTLACSTPLFDASGI